jgi:mono/diheme cytochrome c family protein
LAIIVSVVSVACLAGSLAWAQGAQRPAASPAAAAPAAPDGQALFTANCATCHGANARGGRSPADLGFDFKMPDFGDCSFATREADTDWLSSIHRGGRARGFPRNMPAFDKALSEDEMNAIVAYLRSLCAKSGYPRGEFNLPLAMYTEKAFPEDEVLNQTAINSRGAPGFTSTTVFEKRFGKRGQLEWNLPVSSVKGDRGMQTGIGDMGVAWKQNLYANVDRGSIFSLLGEAVVPTGDEKRGLGQGAATIETHALFGQLLPHDLFFQGDVFGVLPTGNHLPYEVQGHFALGRTFAEDGGWGRSWSPQIEFLAAHELTPGSGVDYDIVPQLQVSLSRRQHVLASIGERIPINNVGPDRQPQFVFYLIWDWYDAGLFKGW